MSGDVPAGSRAGEESARASLSPRQLLLLWLCFVALGLAVYRPALQGGFVSDDIGYLGTNPYVQNPTPENLLAMLDPWGAPAAYVANYSPVHLLLHALEWQVFGGEVVGYHVVNVALHAAVAVLLAALFAASGIAAVAAALGALFFLLHPANVEAVAWISQLKSVAALALALGALLAHPRRPLLGALCFALALLTKASAAFALPVACVFAWVRRRGGARPPARLGWLALWLALAVLYALPEFTSFERVGQTHVAQAEDPLERARTMAAIGMRYLVMATTSHGLSAFHQPPSAGSWLDAWWLAALAAGALLLARALVALRRRSEEAAYWVWAAGAYAPISQLFPFLYPMGDRYLYFVLPGLIGIGLLAGGEAISGLAAALRRRGGTGASHAGLIRAVTALALVWIALFALRSFDRARVWRSDTTLFLDAAAHYPRGISGGILRARRAAQQGDVEAAIAALRDATQSGYDRFMDLDSDPGLQPLRSDPRFRAFVAEVAGSWIATVRARPHPTQLELRVMAQAHLLRGEEREAEAALERGLAVGGPVDAQLRAELARLRKQRERRDAEARGSGHGEGAADDGAGRR